MFRIELQVAEGINFPYYVMGKAQLRILPFADAWVWTDAQADPYALFGQEYGAENRQLEGAEELWYNWLSRTAAVCPDDAPESLRHCQGPLLSIAQSILSEYLTRWPAIHGKLVALLSTGPSEADLLSVLRRNEKTFRLSYPESGREVFHFNHFPTTATQKPGPYFVFGLGCLSLPQGHLLETIAHEVGNTLLWQIVEDTRVAPYRERLERITKQDRYVHGYGSLVEALNWVIGAVAKRGDAVTLDDLPRKPGEAGIARITESLFHHRHLWPRAGIVDFVCTSLEALS